MWKPHNQRQLSQNSHPSSPRELSRGTQALSCSAVGVVRAQSSARALLGHEDQRSLLCHEVMSLSIHSPQTIQRDALCCPSSREEFEAKAPSAREPAQAHSPCTPTDTATQLQHLPDHTPSEGVLHLFDVQSCLIQFSCCSKMPQISVAFLEQQQC